MNKRSSFDEVLLYDPQRIYSVNTNIRKSNLYSKYIWTHNLHSLNRVSKPTTRLQSPASQEKPKPTKNRHARSQSELIQVETLTLPRLTSSQLSAEKQPNENLTSEQITLDDKIKAKNVKRKEITLTETLSGHFDTIKKMVALRKSESEIDFKINELVKDARGKRLLNAQKYEETERNLFDPKNVFSEGTKKSSQDFLNLIMNVHKEMSPESHKVIISNTISSPPRNNIKQKSIKINFNDEKPITKGKILEFKMRERESFTRSKTYGKTFMRIPFTLFREPTEEQNKNS
ncbi:unnamed protein product [Blepharisma stoltei]|uniref:Uncharacterized protein n=1 Tax=Blepharisma stoltei TaxID=1481888 RepID=A0AAU9KIG9_9CILI|nr:unnamed protein product [Blepharisma stoltei]